MRGIASKDPKKIWNTGPGSPIDWAPLPHQSLSANRFWKPDLFFFFRIEKSPKMHGELFGPINWTYFNLKRSRNPREKIKTKRKRKDMKREKLGLGDFLKNKA